MPFKSDPQLQGLWLMEEVSGNRADSSGNGNTLTDTNTVASSTTHQEGARSADFEADASESLQITDAAQVGLDITGNITVLAWILLESRGHMQIAGKWTATGNLRNYMLSLYDNSDTTYRLSGQLSPDGTASTRALGATNLTTGSWWHCAMVYDGSNITVYVNGVQDTNGINNPIAFTGALADTASPFTLGTHGGAYFFDGLMDEVAVFSRALSAAEILNAYTYGIRLPIPAMQYSYRRRRTN